MDQPCTLKDITDIPLHLPGKVRIQPLVQNTFSNILSKGSGKGRHFQGMSQPCADEITFVQGKYLGLILKPAKRRAANDPVIVLFKFTSQIPCMNGLRRVRHGGADPF